MKRLAALLLVVVASAPAATNSQVPDEAMQTMEDARKRWSESPHGPMLERILPPTYEAAQLPEPKSRGAQLALQYCVQCHNLANPAMHNPGRWPRIVERMVLRMEGRGNMGELMKDMMAGVSAPSEQETGVLIAYLRKHGQRALDPKKFPDVDRPEGQSFKLACQQCHALPDPRRHTAQEWPAVVARMEKNMQWMNRVVGNQAVPGEPQLKVEEIVDFLVRHAK
jgi:cytochrome c2